MRGSERLGDARLVVGGIGRDTLLPRPALAGLENEGADHRTGTYLSYDGNAPASVEEFAQLDRVGGRPMPPRKLVSEGFTDKLGEGDFEDHVVGAANPEGALITKELGTCLLERLAH
ncbi:hypothetical protein [Streptomyces sp. NPDC057939]|uniref:hypothetical protein n=1 Tax=Streptomyces sp. NPDC057939 TaxID=3346284 RepID=UPI0036E0A00B